MACHRVWRQMTGAYDCVPHTCQVLAGGQAHWRADHAGQDGGS